MVLKSNGYGREERDVGDRRECHPSDVALEGRAGHPQAQEYLEPQESG